MRRPATPPRQQPLRRSAGPGWTAKRAGGSCWPARRSCGRRRVRGGLGANGAGAWALALTWPTISQPVLHQPLLCMKQLITFHSPTPPYPTTERLRAKAAAVAQESAEAAALQKQLAAQERELSRQAAHLAKEAAEAEVRDREASKQLSQAEATQAALERRAEELNGAEVRVRELQVSGLWDPNSVGGAFPPCWPGARPSLRCGCHTPCPDPPSDPPARCARSSKCGRWRRARRSCAPSRWVWVGVGEPWAAWGSMGLPASPRAGGRRAPVPAPVR